jgi:hypothetical protein
MRSEMTRDDENEVERLRALLYEYGRHQEGCSAAHGDKYRCRCGWREVEQNERGDKPDEQDHAHHAADHPDR